MFYLIPTFCCSHVCRLGRCLIEQKKLSRVHRNVWTINKWTCQRPMHLPIYTVCINKLNNVYWQHKQAVGNMQTYNPMWRIEREESLMYFRKYIFHYHLELFLFVSKNKTFSLKIALLLLTNTLESPCTYAQIQ